MVLSLGAGNSGLGAGDPPPECQQDMMYVRYTVIGVMICIVGTFFFGGLPLGDVVYVLCGIFACKEDAVLSRWHACLMRSPLATCGGPTGGGGSCLLPIVTISFMNVIFGLFALVDPMNTLPFIWMSLMTQAYGGYVAYRVLSVIRNSAMNPDFAHPGDSLSEPLHAPAQQNLNHVQTSSSQPGRPFNSFEPPHAAGHTREVSFQPFQGQGQKLSG